MDSNAQAQSPEKSVSVNGSQKAFQVLKDRFHPLQEEIWVLGLNSSLNIMVCELVFRGTANACLIHPRDIFRILVLSNSTSFILSHNHPLTRPIPSENDLAFTKNLLKAAKIFEIPMIDHLIIGLGTYFSFADQHLLSGKRGQRPHQYPCRD